MRILQIANGDFSSTYGGGQVYVKNVVDEMIRQRLSVCVFSFVNKQSEISFEKKDYKGIDLYELYTKDKKIIIGLIKQIQPEIIHVHAEKALFASIRKELASFTLVVTAHHGGITCPAGALMNTKDEICKLPVSHENCLVCVLRNTKGGLKAYPLIKQIPLKQRFGFGQWLNKLPFIYFVTPYGQSSLSIEKKMKDWETIADYADCMIAPSNAIADNMILNGLSEDKIKVIPHGTPTGSHSPNSSSISINSHTTKFFYVGRLGYIKGIHILLQAFVQLNTSGCELHLIGDTSRKYERQLIKQYKYHSNIIFHGKIKPDEVLNYIKRFDVLIHPAIYLEVFGLNISEALSQGKPIIATRCGGAEMQIKDKENGLLIEPNNTEAIGRAMQYFINNPNEIKRMSINAPINVISIEEHVKQLVTIYNDLTHEK